MKTRPMDSNTPRQGHLNLVSQSQQTGIKRRLSSIHSASHISRFSSLNRNQKVSSNSDPPHTPGPGPRLHKFTETKWLNNWGYIALLWGSEGGTVLFVPDRWTGLTTSLDLGTALSFLRNRIKWGKSGSHLMPFRYTRCFFFSNATFSLRCENHWLMCASFPFSWPTY